MSHIDRRSVLGLAAVAGATVLGVTSAAALPRTMPSTGTTPAPELPGHAPDGTAKVEQVRWWWGRRRVVIVRRRRRWWW